jgi:hypothetical protein
MLSSRRAVLFAVVALTMAWPAPVQASVGWTWPVTGPVVLAYGSTYVGSSGKTCTHGGLDIGSDSGTSVRSSVSGQVSFAGRVPAGEGAQAFAVTVLTADGLRVTYLPLRSVSVHRGENVSGGEPLGVLDASGDASAAQSHLHFGVRRGDTQLDPASFLGSASPQVPVAAPVKPPASKSSGPGLPVRPRSTAPAPARSSVHSPSGAPVRSKVTAPNAARAGATSLDAAIKSAAGASSGVLARTPALTRVREVSEAPVLDLTRAIADLRSGQGWLAGLLTRLALVAVGGACVAPVMRGIRTAAAARRPDVALARRPVR